MKILRILVVLIVFITVLSNCTKDKVERNNPFDPGGVNYKTYTISGNVSGADDVIVTLSGDSSDTLIVNDGETYSFTIGIGGSYTVKPVRAGYFFSPVNKMFTSISSNQTQHFSGESILSNGKIAFVSARDGNLEIYVMDADGSNQLRLTNHPDEDFGPSFSMDGARIAFVSDRDGNSEIYIMNADGSNQQNITNHSNDDNYPSWSPDGSKIAFVSNIYNKEMFRFIAWKERYIIK